jgi:uncharacterized protein (DUF2147 family)
MRHMKFIMPAAIALSLAPVSLESAFAGTDPTGVWMNDTGRGAIEIKACGNALCGNVVWVKSSADADGCGKQIIGGVTAVGGGHWDNGWIYSPEKGRKYDVELTPLSNGNLKVVGYAGMKFLSKTMIWKPAPADLQLCTASTGLEAAKTPAPAAAPPAPVAAAPANPPEQQAKAADQPVPPTAPTTESKPSAAVPPPSATENKTPPEATAKADNAAAEDSDGDGDSGHDLGKMKIGDLELDKVFSKTKDGKCKLDLPWVKVTIDCEQ